MIYSPLCTRLRGRNCHHLTGITYALNTEVIPMDNPLPLMSEWLSEMDQQLDNRTVTRTNQVRTNIEPNASSQQ